MANRISKTTLKILSEHSVRKPTKLRLAHGLQHTRGFTDASGSRAGLLGALHRAKLTGPYQQYPRKSREPKQRSLLAKQLRKLRKNPATRHGLSSLVRHETNNFQKYAGHVSTH